MDVETVIPIGLILNELITNCLKHGLKHLKTPEITITIQEESDQLLLQVLDNGNTSKKPIKEGFGYTIIRTLLDNNGTIVSKNDKEGFCVTVTFNK